MRANVVSAAFLIVASSVFAQPCTLTAPGFARIAGIPGDSTDGAHTKETRLLTIPTKGPSTLTIVKAQDIGTAAVILASVTGQHISTAVITTFDPAQSNTVVSHTLHDVVISAVDVRAGNTNREELTLTFQSIESKSCTGSVSASASAAGGQLPAQVAMASSSWSNLSAFHLSIRTSGGRPQFTASINPAANVPENATMRVRTGQLTWTFDGVKAAAGPRSSLEAGMIARAAGESPLTFTRFEVSAPPNSIGAPTRAAWDLSKQQKV